MELLKLCQSASACRGVIGRLSTEEKNAVLHTAADLLINKEESILSANKIAYPSIMRSFKMIFPFIIAFIRNLPNRFLFSFYQRHI